MPIETLVINLVSYYKMVGIFALDELDLNQNGMNQRVGEINDRLAHHDLFMKKFKHGYVVSKIDGSDWNQISELKVTPKDLEDIKKAEAQVKSFIKSLKV